MVLEFLAWLLVYGGFASTLAFALVQCALHFLLRPQDLRQRYGDGWAFVTGAGSGIGLCIAERLASQGINVVIASLDDPALDQALDHLRTTYPRVTFRLCRVDLAAPVDTYLRTIEVATDDVCVRFVFCNAGFMVPGLVLGSIVAAHERQIQCNATSAVALAHHFANRMVNENSRGFICFTSSASAFMPSPTAATYAATKAFLTSFATAFAAEMRPKGVDVLVTHPSPIRSQFWTGSGDNIQQPSLNVHNFARSAASPPAVVVDRIFANAGRCVYADQGFLTWTFRIIARAC
jgi:short-subunit dehydrogenase